MTVKIDDERLTLKYRGQWPSGRPNHTSYEFFWRRYRPTSRKKSQISPSRGPNAWTFNAAALAQAALFAFDSEIFSDTNHPSSSPTGTRKIPIFFNEATSSPKGVATILGKPSIPPLLRRRIRSSSFDKSFSFLQIVTSSPPASS